MRYKLATVRHGIVLVVLALISAINDPGDYYNYRAQLIPATKDIPVHVVNYKGKEWIGRSVFGIDGKK